MEWLNKGKCSWHSEHFVKKQPRGKSGRRPHSPAPPNEQEPGKPVSRCQILNSGFTFCSFLWGWVGRRHQRMSLGDSRWPSQSQGKTFGDVPSPLLPIVHGEDACEDYLGFHSAVQPLGKLQRSPSFVVRRVDRYSWQVNIFYLTRLASVTSVIQSTVESRKGCASCLWAHGSPAVEGLRSETGGGCFRIPALKLCVGYSPRWHLKVHIRHQML